MKIFLDTSFLVAFYNKEDKNHTQARNFMANADHGFTGQRRQGLVIEAGRKILEDARIDLLRIDTEVFDKAWLVYQSFRDKQWSFTDCTSYVLMKNLAIHTGASFDNHFDQFGFITVPK
jgi:predicted nucleic acid-binding protein